MGAFWAMSPRVERLRKENEERSPPRRRKGTLLHLASALRLVGVDPRMTTAGRKCGACPASKVEGNSSAPGQRLTALGRRKMLRGERRNKTAHALASLENIPPDNQNGSPISLGGNFVFLYVGVSLSSQRLSFFSDIWVGISGVQQRNSGDGTG